MNISGLGVVLFGIAVVAWIVFYIGYSIHVHENCDNGHVLKNQFDWPVCVR